MKSTIKFTFIFLFVLAFANLYAQIDDIEKVNNELREKMEEVQQGVDNHTASIDSMDKMAQDLQEKNDALAD